ncbi:MAG: hypothetical protein E7440_02780 [Ruminococcaceae bacterium]|nr:hypothetical protein [Oscillospiraceae bacterium]
MFSFRPIPLLCVTALLFCAGCTPQQPPHSPFSPEASVSQSTLSDEPSVPVMAPINPSQPAASEPDAPAPVSPDPVPIPSPQVKEPMTESSAEQPNPPSPAPESSPFVPIVSDYDFSQPVPETTPVENDFFADAAFVGDSRMEGFYLYSGIKKGKKLATTGLSVFNLSKKTVLTTGGVHYTLPEALSLTQYKKIYLGFGVNELGYIDENSFYTAYCQTIDIIRSSQPNAVIYAQTMIPVNEERVRATGGAGHLNNDRLRMYNELIRKAAQEKQVPLLDLYSAFAVDGSLPTEASRDGVHLTGDYCKMQLSYLKTHTIDFDTLYSPAHPETEVPRHEATAAPDPTPLPEPDPDLLLSEAEQAPIPAGSAPDTSGF